LVNGFFDSFRVAKQIEGNWLMSRIHIYQAQIIEVIDGDTFDLMIDQGFGNFTKQRMRLYGIDAPELRTNLGKDLKRRLSSEYYCGQVVVQSIEATTNRQFRDKYGRFLAVIYDAWPIAPRAIANGDKIIEVAPLSLNAKLIGDDVVKERYW
jgi:endonuclease YncB( thermonuclease family)